MRQAAALVIVVGFLICGCTSRDQVVRVTSPDGQTGTWTPSSSNRIVARYVTSWTKFGWSQGEAAMVTRWLGSTFDDAVRSQRAWGVNVKWDSAHHLVIEYLSAGQAKLLMQKAVIAGQDVQISMHDGISDPLAPAGEMLHHPRSEDMSPDKQGNRTGEPLHELANSW